MAMAPARPCPHPKCGKLDCAEHAAVDWRPQHGPPDVKRIRGRELQRLREALFRRFPFCAECVRQGKEPPNRATIRDHIVPLQEGGTEDESNVQGLCAECSDKKTCDESKRGVRRWTADAYDAQIGQRRRKRQLR